EAALAGASGAKGELVSRARYTLGVAALRQGDYRAAAAALAQVTEHPAGEEPWLATRPRVRLLQALQWGGRLEEARAWAERFRPELGSWGTNTHLELLVRSCLEPQSPPEPVVCAAPALSGAPP